MQPWPWAVSVAILVGLTGLAQRPSDATLLLGNAAVSPGRLCCG